MTRKKRSRLEKMNIQAVVSHMHVYSSFQESLIKTLLFLVAFLISVLPLFIGGSNDTQQLGESTPVEQSFNIANLSTNNTSENADLNDMGEKQDSSITAAGALIVYGISLIAEVCMLLDPRDYLSKKLLTGTILLIGIVMTVFGFGLVFVPNFNINPQIVAVVGFLAVAVYIVDTTFYYIAAPIDSHLCKSNLAKLRKVYVEG